MGQSCNENKVLNDFFGDFLFICFGQVQNIPSLTAGGLSGTNCVVTEIYTTQKSLFVQMEPIPNAMPCTFAKNHRLNITLETSNCNHCIAPNPPPNQHVRTVVQWSVVQGTRVSSSSSCPISWYKTKPSAPCASQDGARSHFDTKEDSNAYSRRMDLSCDPTGIHRGNARVQCNVDDSKYVASDGTVVTSTKPAYSDGTVTDSLSHLFDRSVTINHMNPSDSYFRASFGGEAIIKITFPEPRRITLINYRSRFTNKKPNRVKAVIKEGYVGKIDGQKVEDILLDNFRFRKKGQEHQPDSTQYSWTWMQFKQWHSLHVPRLCTHDAINCPEWAGLYGKRPLWVQEVWFYVQEANGFCGMDEIELWEYSLDEGMSTEHCECNSDLTNQRNFLNNTFLTEDTTSVECAVGEYCFANAGKCLPKELPVAEPMWLGDTNCGCGIGPFRTHTREDDNGDSSNYCSSCEGYKCIGTCKWPRCEDVQDIHYNGRVYNHPCRCSSFSSWELATSNVLAQYSNEGTTNALHTNSIQSYQYLFASGRSYWMSPVTSKLWSWSSAQTVYGTWTYNANGWNEHEALANVNQNSPMVGHVVLLVNGDSEEQCTHSVCPTVDASASKHVNIHSGAVFTLGHGGKFDEAHVFSGTGNSTLKFAGSTDWSFEEKDFTIEMWVKLNSTTHRQAFISHGSPNANGGGLNSPWTVGYTPGLEDTTEPVGLFGTFGDLVTSVAEITPNQDPCPVGTGIQDSGACLNYGTERGYTSNPNACPASHPYLETDNNVEDGKLCWDSTEGANSGTACTNWCLLPQHEDQNPGGHLTNCPGNVCMAGTVGDHGASHLPFCFVREADRTVWYNTNATAAAAAAAAAATTASAPACVDTVGWDDVSSSNCNDYGNNGWCSGGAVVNNAYANYGAEENCCACGGGTTPAADTPVTAPDGEWII